MNEKEKYERLYSRTTAPPQPDIIPGKMGGGYGRICWGENILETLRQWKVSSLLDVGCGYGNFCHAATFFADRVYGLDIASVATGNIIENPDITFLDGEAKSLPLPRNAVQWVTSFDCLEHCLVQDIDQILHEFDRVASKGFVLSISYEPCEMAGVPLHMTVKPESWWMTKLKKYGEVSKLGHAPITGAPYLICRKPVDRKLICYCAGSLGTRLRSLNWAQQWSRHTGRSLAMMWLPQDPLCRADFTALFSTPIAQVSQEALLELESCKIYATVKALANQALISTGKALRSAIRRWQWADLQMLARDDDQDNIVLVAPHFDDTRWGDNSEIFYRQLSLLPALMDRLRALVAQMNLDKQVMGVHARGSDFGINAATYVQQMERAIRRQPNQRFLVCSEDRLLEQQLKQYFKDRVMIRAKSAYQSKLNTEAPWTMDNIETSTASVTEALMDLYLLAHTNFKIYHESSAFAQVVKTVSATLPVRPIVNVHAGSSEGFCPPAGNQKSPTGRVVDRPSITANGRPDHTIYYCCPDFNLPSAGIGRIYRHVAILHKAGFNAAVLHKTESFQVADMPRVPIVCMDQIEADRNTVFVIPEGMPTIMHRLKDHPGRRFVIALSWHYIFSTLPDGMDWRHLNIERAMAVSQSTGQLIAWAMALPVHYVGTSIDHQQYYCDPAGKQLQIAYITRKSAKIQRLKRLLASRNTNYIEKIKWVGLEGRSLEDYASQIRHSAIFLSLSTAEGFPTSCLEAMASGTIVAGYDGVGGRDLLCGQGPQCNCILAPSGDYLALAYKLAPLLDDLILWKTGAVAIHRCPGAADSRCLYSRG